MLPWNLWFLKEPPGKTWHLVVEWTGWTKLYKRGVHVSKSTMPWRREAKMAEAKEAKTAYSDAKHMAKHAGKERWIHHSIPRWWWWFPYCQTDEPHKRPGRRWWGLRMQWCWSAFAHWRRLDEGMVEHYPRLLNVELEWPSNKLHRVPPNAGLQLRCWKLSWVGKTTGGAVFSSGGIPTDWEERFILNLYKGKVNSLGLAITVGSQIKSWSYWNRC